MKKWSFVLCAFIICVPTYLCADFSTATGLVVHRQISGDGSHVLLRLPYPAYTGYSWEPPNEPLNLRDEDESLKGLVPSYMAGDGQTILGYYIRSDGNPEAFRWRASLGLEGLGDLDGGRFDSDALGCSADGSVVFGKGRVYTGYRAMRWTKSEGMIDLLPDEDKYKWTFAVDCSEGGQVVVGSAQVDGKTMSYIWNEGTITLLGLMPDAVGTKNRENYPLACSPDGTRLFGYGYHADLGINQGANSIWSWTTDDGFEDFLAPIGGDLAKFSATAYVTEGLGSIVVGFLDWDDGGILRWREKVGIDLLEYPGKSSTAWQSSADGNIVVGMNIGLDDVPRAVVWDQFGKMHFLEDLLAATGIDTGGRELVSAHAISADGRSIAGQLPLEDNKSVAYHVTLSGLWSFDEPIAERWRQSPWYGNYYMGPGTVIYHEDHGWQDYFTGDFFNVYYYDHATQNWFWTSSDYYPFFYIVGTMNRWVYYRIGSNPREFVDVETGAAFSEEDLIPPP